MSGAHGEVGARGEWEQLRVPGDRDPGLERRDRIAGDAEAVPLRDGAIPGVAAARSRVELQRCTG